MSEERKICMWVGGCQMLAGMTGLCVWHHAQMVEVQRVANEPSVRCAHQVVNNATKQCAACGVFIPLDREVVPFTRGRSAAEAKLGEQLARIVELEKEVAELRVELSVAHKGPLYRSPSQTENAMLRKKIAMLEAERGPGLKHEPLIVALDCDWD